MDDLLKGIDLESGVTLNNAVAFMDGGSVMLWLTDSNQTPFEILFCQSVSLGKRSNPDAWIPGNFLLNNTEVPIRSNGERKILSALKSFKFSDKIPFKHRAIERELIDSRIAFVESEDYLKIASEMGRI
ncbi:hypothetical protein [Hymenobacter convexus]|uniref:hypothetical protein n=1 Tax=Hymenobacter sp. CA1UV-4 TaxID=3063782 RepID=UPI0027134761|nr:hypothetical protein [Hymenobacter sp. CA1UV-4]MDO7851263.1 hypothetical protein [Hymenobacter sp. CA1UV-4]